MGYTALYYNTSSYNTAVGDGAGKYYTGGLNNTTGYGGLFLGFGTYAKSNADVYETVIGPTAIGNGSNTTTIGPLATNTDIYLNGRLNLPAGSNKSTGQATLVSGTITVSNTIVRAGSLIFLTHAGSGTAANFGTLYLGTITASTSFIIKSTNASDNDVVNWWIVN